MRSQALIELHYGMSGDDHDPSALLQALVHRREATEGAVSVEQAWMATAWVVTDLLWVREQVAYAQGCLSRGEEDAARTALTALTAAMSRLANRAIDLGVIGAALIGDLAALEAALDEVSGELPEP